ncbi:MAG: citrate synthase [Ilumatobacter sp.]|uniref:citrate synthase n=1 Tax=Ilumatobacter sp. TaxID=1967498 RepID=UPI0026200AD5|nr:citrate synthase [Ilumatobacter sp.]MDJ0771691.1 citrate synthase [Ilumatobacter sp.]
MPTYIGATEAARLLGVTKPTLYAYVSRGLLDRRTAVDGRTSLYARDDIEELANRSRRRAPVERPSIDVQIASSITTLSDERLSFRGHDAVALATSGSFEQAAELLWSGELPEDVPRWPVDRTALRQARDHAAAIDDPLARLSMSALSLSSRTDGAPAGAPPGAAAARRLLGIAPSVLGGPQRGDLATRLTAAWCGRSSPAVVAAVSRALVLLADHELATSTLAVRVAASVRAEPYAALSTGLNVVGGSLHGAASRIAADMLASAQRDGAERTVRARLAAGRLPGFGHTVYRNGDPRLAPLLDAVSAIPHEGGRWDVVADVLAVAGRHLGKHPNVDLGLAALLFVGRLPLDAPLFAIARLAGWGAHYDEEIGERAVRFRGLTSAR